MSQLCNTLFWISFWLHFDWFMCVRCFDLPAVPMTSVPMSFKNVHNETGLALTIRLLTNLWPTVWLSLNERPTDDCDEQQRTKRSNFGICTAGEHKRAHLMSAAIFVTDKGSIWALPPLETISVTMWVTEDPRFCKCYRSLKRTPAALRINSSTN